ncbi:MAG: hypothetical protein LBM38_03990 [Clostridiales bacterium]|jgi:hypothetical protein|nr:hypothetical protein [Clostridiales bacterium]
MRIKFLPKKIVAVILVIAMVVGFCPANSSISYAENAGTLGADVNFGDYIKLNSNTWRVVSSSDKDYLGGTYLMLDQPLSSKREYAKTEVFQQSGIDETVEYYESDLYTYLNNSFKSSYLYGKAGELLEKSHNVENVSGLAAADTYVRLLDRTEAEGINADAATPLYYRAGTSAAANGYYALAGNLDVTKTEPEGEPKTSEAKRLAANINGATKELTFEQVSEAKATETGVGTDQYNYSGIFYNYIIRPIIKVDLSTIMFKTGNGVAPTTAYDSISDVYGKINVPSEVSATSGVIIARDSDGNVLSEIEFAEGTKYILDYDYDNYRLGDAEFVEIKDANGINALPADSLKNITITDLDGTSLGVGSLPIYAPISVVSSIDGEPIDDVDIIERASDAGSVSETPITVDKTEGDIRYVSSYATAPSQESDIIVTNEGQKYEFISNAKVIIGNRNWIGLGVVQVPRHNDDGTYKSFVSVTINGEVAPIVQAVDESTAAYITMDKLPKQNDINTILLYYNGARQYALGAGKHITVYNSVTKANDEFIVSSNPEIVNIALVDEDDNVVTTPSWVQIGDGGLLPMTSGKATISKDIVIDDTTMIFAYGDSTKENILSGLYLKKGTEKFIISATLKVKDVSSGEEVDWPQTGLEDNAAGAVISIDGTEVELLPTTLGLAGSIAKDVTLTSTIVVLNNNKTIVQNKVVYINDMKFDNTSSVILKDRLALEVTPAESLDSLPVAAHVPSFEQDVIDIAQNNGVYNIGVYVKNISNVSSMQLPFTFDSTKMQITQIRKGYKFSGDPIYQRGENVDIQFTPNDVGLHMVAEDDPINKQGQLIIGYSAFDQNENYPVDVTAGGNLVAVITVKALAVADNFLSMQMINQIAAPSVTREAIEGSGIVPVYFINSDSVVSKIKIEENDVYIKLDYVDAHVNQNVGKFTISARNSDDGTYADDQTVTITNMVLGEPSAMGTLSKVGELYTYDPSATISGEEYIGECDIIFTFTGYDLVKHVKYQSIATELSSPWSQRLKGRNVYAHRYLFEISPVMASINIGDLENIPAQLIAGGFDWTLQEIDSSGTPIGGLKHNQTSTIGNENISFDLTNVFSEDDYREQRRYRITFDIAFDSSNPTLLSKTWHNSVEFRLQKGETLSANVNLGGKVRDNSWYIMGWDKNPNIDKGITVDLVGVKVGQDGYEVDIMNSTTTDIDGNYTLFTNNLEGYDLSDPADKGYLYYAVMYSRRGGTSELRDERYLLNLIKLDTSGLTGAEESELQDGSGNLLTTTLSPGAFSESTIIKPEDYYAVRDRIGAGASNRVYKTYYDINEVNGIDPSDLAIMRINLGKMLNFDTLEPVVPVVTYPPTD